MPPTPPSRGAIFSDSRGKSHPEATNAWLAELARGRKGIVGRQRALAAGIDPDVIDERLANGGLYTVYAGVYAVGHQDLCDEAWWHAAVEACGEGAAISHDSGVRAYRLLPDFPLHPVHVTRPRERGPARRKGIVAHRPMDFHPLDVAVVDGLPVTTVPRVLLDMAVRLRRDRLALAIHKARVEHRMPGEALRAVMRRAPRHRGLRRLHSVAFGEGVAPNKRERRFLRLVRDAGLPRPENNVLIQTEAGTFLVDFLWPEQRLIYEIDDFDSHTTAKSFVDDRHRDNALGDAAYRVRRVTDEDLWPHAARTMARLARQLRCDSQR